MSSDWQDALPRPKGGRFWPGQHGWFPLVPGYSCRHCGCITARIWSGVLLVHAWNRSPFCSLRRGDLHLAQVYREP